MVFKVTSISLQYGVNTTHEKDRYDSFTNQVDVSFSLLFQLQTSPCNQRINSTLQSRFTSLVSFEKKTASVMSV